MLSQTAQQGLLGSGHPSKIWLDVDAVRNKEETIRGPKNPFREKTSTVPARLRPVTIPNRAHISWTDAISGRENGAVQSGAYPNDAPATEYAEIPDGEAPCFCFTVFSSFALENSRAA
jgi:hypothetical protein